ncbi:MAG: hypothetical protein M1819_007281 [Sarea resinae]|nr:MAG: hypothetical protein M1819_007281 [Sarea resinae]
MVNIEPFAVEQWMDTYETRARYNLAETCCASISFSDLKGLCGLPENSASHDPLDSFVNTKLTYGAIRGSENLRRNIGSLYATDGLPPLPFENILPVIMLSVTLFSLPASLGAELKKLLKPNTKLIIINNPNNPTGAALPQVVLEKIVSLARERDIYVLSDEVYRPLFHSPMLEHPEAPPSILAMGYSKTIATGSLSKAFALAGIRVGWIASQDDAIIKACALRRDYTTISVSQLDDRVADFALGKGTVQKLLQRNLKLAKTNLEIVRQFMNCHVDITDWVRPTAGTTAFVRFKRGGRPVDDVEFCKQLQEKTGVMFCPGSKCFGEEFSGYIRIGYACETAVLEAGLEKLTTFLENEYDHIPTAI